jgi:hypothetical protein
MHRRIRVGIVRLFLVASLAAVTTAIVAAEAAAKPAPHPAGTHLLPGGTLPAGWVFPVIVLALAVATITLTLYAPNLRAVLFGRRRRRRVSPASIAGVPSGAGSIQQGARRPAA